MITYDKKQLSKAGSDFQLPFFLPLEGSEHELCCEQVLRVIPGNRAVFRGKWRGKSIIVKLFYKPFRINHQLKKEVRGSRAVQEAGIDSYRILYAGKTKRSHIGVVILDDIHPANDVSGVWNAMDDIQERRALFVKILSIVARMHQAGIKQQDLHLNNFLLKNNTVYVIDNASVKRHLFARPLGKRESLDNLALLFAQMPLPDYHLVQDLYKEYLKVRGWNDSERFFSRLQGKVMVWLMRRMNSKCKKIFRNSSEHITHKSFFRFTACRKSHYTPEIEAFLKNPDEKIDLPPKVLLKNGNSSTVKKISTDHSLLVVKRYNIKNFYHGLRRAFMPSRAAWSWRNAHRLLILGIATAKPVAMVENRFGPFRNKAYFICEYVEGDHIIDFFHKNSHGTLSEIAHQVADIFSMLKSVKISHRDMKGTNIIINEDKPVLIDLDGMRRHVTRFSFTAAHQKDIRRFLKNWQSDQETAEMFRELINRK